VFVKICGITNEGDDSEATGGERSVESTHDED
jgi:hypothetical protein